jgi:hypothetical protein
MGICIGTGIGIVVGIGIISGRLQEGLRDLGEDPRVLEGLLQAGAPAGLQEALRHSGHEKTTVLHNTQKIFGEYVENLVRV